MGIDMSANTAGETPGQAVLSNASPGISQQDVMSKSSETSNVNGDTQNEPERSAMNCNTPCAPDKDASAGFITGPQRTELSHFTPEPKLQDGDLLNVHVHVISMHDDAGSNAGQQQDTPWVNGYSSEEISKIQRTDSDIGVILDWLDKSLQRPGRDLAASQSPATRKLWLLWQQLIVRNGVIYKRWVTMDKTQSYLQLVVPKELQDTILRATHDAVTSAHLGVKKTVHKTKRKFYWYRLKESVRNWIRKCAKCGARKLPHKTPRATLQDYRVGAPMDRLVTDILGPLPISEQGNRYILLVGDQFSKWMEAYAIHDQTAETVAHKIVYEFISRFGTPLDLHSDQGRNYESNLFRSVCKLLEINKTRTSPYHPSAKGQAEKFNQVLVDMISAYVDDNQRN